MTAEILSCSTRVVTTVAFIVGLGANVAVKINSLVEASAVAFAQMFGILKKIGFTHSTMPASFKAAQNLFFGNEAAQFTHAEMFEVASDIYKSSVCKAREIAGISPTATKSGTIQVGDETVKVGFDAYKHGEKIAENSNEIQSLNVSKTATSKAVVILTVITISMTIIWLTINEILKSLWD
jgi:hypothetical protein